MKLKRKPIKDRVRIIAYLEQKDLDKIAQLLSSGPDITKEDIQALIQLPHTVYFTHNGKQVAKRIPIHRIITNILVERTYMDHYSGRFKISYTGTLFAPTTVTHEKVNA